MSRTGPSDFNLEGGTDGKSGWAAGRGFELIEEADEQLEQSVHIEFEGDSRKRKIFIRLVQIGIVCLLIGLWQYMANGSETLFLTLGNPWSIINHHQNVPGIAQWLYSWMTNGPIPHGRGWPDLATTLGEAGYGYAIGATAGILFGALLGSVTWLRTFSRPFIAMMNAFPKIALAPLFILIFGSTFSMKAYFVAAGVTFITFYAVFNGIRAIDPTYLHNARILGAGRFWIVREVYCPALVGWVTAALRLTAAWSISGAVLAEYLTANSGMGFVIGNGQLTYVPQEVFGSLFIVSLVALVIDRTLYQVSRRFNSWRLA